MNKAFLVTIVSDKNCRRSFKSKKAHSLYDEITLYFMTYALD